MKISDEKWGALRAAVVDDDQEGFESLLSEAARIFVAHSRDFAICCDKVRSRERGVQPFACWER